MRKVLIYISLIVFAVGGCKKVDLDEVPLGDPVFTASAMFGTGAELNFVAGDDDIYMFSEFSKDNLEVYTMTGRFAKDANCENDCEESLSFSIRSSSVDSLPNLPFDINSALIQETNLDYYSNNNSNSIGYNYSFNAEYIDAFSASQAGSFSWQISSDSFSFISLSESFSLAYLGETDIYVRLEITSTGGCTSYIQKIIPLGLLDDCDLSVNIDLDSFNFPMFFLTPSFVNNPTSTINWINATTNDDTLIIDSNTVIPPSGLFELIASSGNQQCLVELGICPELEPNMGFPESFSFPKINYTVDAFSVGNPPEEQLSAVTIEYQDATGIYSSEFADTSNNTFTITKIEDYDDNENGEKTKILTIDYNCILQKEGSGETKNISGTAEIAVAYPD
jgi:hypothetical protein